jgi:hypothetical protein
MALSRFVAALTALGATLSVFVLFSDHSFADGVTVRRRKGSVDAGGAAPSNA